MIKCQEYKDAQLALIDDMINVVRCGYYCNDEGDCLECDYYYRWKDTDGVTKSSCMIRDLISEFEKVRSETKAEPVQNS